MPDHRYVSDPDSLPPPREFTEGLLGVVASLESMVLRREMLLYAFDVQVPSLQTGPSRPSRAARRGVSARGQEGRRALVRRDDKSSEEESAHPQSETSAGRDDDYGSSSEGGGDAEEDSEDGGSDSDGGADDGGA